MSISFSRTNLRLRPVRQEVLDLLARYSLGLDNDVEHIIEAREEDGSLVACGGLAGNVLKSIAISDAVRGGGFALTLMTELISTAWEMERHNLFLYTKPENEMLFAQCGFSTLASVPGYAVLMENSKTRLARYCEELAGARKPGARIGGLVMNCNPFTNGHRYLVEETAKVCDWVHLFLVKEDLAMFPCADRLHLVQEGTRGIANLTVHPGSEYMISQATFPRYFLKGEANINHACAGLDIQIFRTNIAPALGITDRFVGDEPFCALTSSYNDELSFWLQTPEIDAPPVALTIIPRTQEGEVPISASRVRKLWKAEGPEAVRPLVPESTYVYLRQHDELRRSHSS